MGSEDLQLADRCNLGVDQDNKRWAELPELLLRARCAEDLPVDLPEQPWGLRRVRDGLPLPPSSPSLLRRRRLLV